MKKFIFSLGKILNYKSGLYEKERSALAQLRATRLAIEHRRDDTDQQMLQKDAEFRGKAANGGVPVSEVMQINFHRENSHRLIKQFNEEMAVLDLAIARQLEIVIQLDKDVKGLEKLKEKQFEEYSLEAAKEERERISEMISTKFINNKLEEAYEETLREQKS